MKPIDNFIISEHILPFLVNKMLQERMSLEILSSSDFIKSHINPNIPIAFDWSELDTQYSSLNKRYGMAFITFPQPQYGQSKYGLIIEDKECNDGQNRLKYFTLEQSLSILDNKTTWMICSPTADGRHTNYGTLQSLPTPYNFATSVCEIHQVEIKKSEVPFWKRLFSKETKNQISRISHKYDLCCFSEKAYSKVCEVIDELHKEKVNVGVMLGHRIDNGCIIVVDCYFCGARNINEGFGFDHDQLIKNVQIMSNEYHHPLSFIGYIHSQPDNYLSNIDELSSFQSSFEINDASILGIVSNNREDKLSVYEFYQQNITNTCSNFWNYSLLKLEVDTSLDPIIPKDYLSYK